ncbi:MAG: glycosyltransferase, partial [Bacteroidia bacterium]|nr:glycosyltransferase [Bacteroidia bacterium]
MDLAPITLFTYNRPDHTQKTLDALSKNPEASQSTLYVFCDGPKANASEEERETINKVVKIVKKEQRFKDVIISVQEQNQGLAKSIVTGVTEIVNEHNSVIVLEDDIITSSGFLKYMNNALRIYANDTEVMHISGYMYPLKEELPETFFLKVPLCWGWAT